MKHSIVYKDQRTGVQLVCKTSEHLYQALKFLGDSDVTPTAAEIAFAKIIASTNTPFKSKILANQQTSNRYKWNIPLNEQIEQSKKDGVTFRKEWFVFQLLYLIYSLSLHFFKHIFTLYFFDVLKRYHCIVILIRWDSVKDDAMRKVLRIKFETNPDCRQMLLNTPDDSILSEHTTRDLYWGDGGEKRNGKNMLGKLLMELRSQLRSESLSVPQITSFVSTTTKRKLSETTKQQHVSDDDVDDDDNNEKDDENQNTKKIKIEKK